MSTADSTKQLIINAYIKYGTEIGCFNASSSCLSTEAEYDSVFNTRMNETYQKMGFPVPDITQNLIDTTKGMYDNAIAAAIQSANCAQQQPSTYEAWTNQMQVLFVGLNDTNPSPASCYAAVDAIQTRIVRMNCQKNCQLKIKL